MQFARAAGAGHVLIVEPSELRRRIGLELGASMAVGPDEAADAVQALTGGIGADVVFECAGVPSLLQTAVDLTRSGGLVSLVSFLAQPATINAGRWLAKEITLVASNAFTHDDFRRSMAFLADGRVKAGPLHTRTVSLDQLEATLRELSAGPSDDIKVLVDPREHLPAHSRKAIRWRRWGSNPRPSGCKVSRTGSKPYQLVSLDTSEKGFRGTAQLQDGRVGAGRIDTSLIQRALSGHSLMEPPARGSAVVTSRRWPPPGRRRWQRPARRDRAGSGPRRPRRSGPWPGRKRHRARGTRR